MNRCVLTMINGKNPAYLLLDENRNLLELQVFEPLERSLLGNIYSARVEKLVPSIDAAFVQIADGQKGYLPLSKAQNPVYTKKQAKKEQLCAGDELLVQVVKDAVKTKDPVVSAQLTLHGRFSVLTTGNMTLGVSHKLSAEQTAAFAGELAALVPQENRDYGIVFRTNSADVTAAERAADVTALQEKYQALITNAVHQTSGSLVLRSLPGYLERLQHRDFSDTDEIVTDSPQLYEEMEAQLPTLRDKIRLYQDTSVSLSTLYGLNAKLQELLSPRVWLPSGAYLIIEQLETLTFIDVNSGKNQSKHPDSLHAVNLEAASELARQIRLRNISGMIMVDFINEKKEQEKELIQELRRALKKDPVPTSFIDITGLGLAELTRQKLQKPLREILANKER